MCFLSSSVPEFFATLLIQVGNIMPENGFAFNGCDLFELEDKHGNDIDEDDVQDY